jgi:hypothetical protein
MAAAQREAVTLRARDFYPKDTVLTSAVSLSDSAVRDHIQKHYGRDVLLMAQATIMG